jgi:hypothetical protein
MLDRDPAPYLLLELGEHLGGIVTGRPSTLIG